MTGISGKYFFMFARKGAIFTSEEIGGKELSK